MRAFESFPLLGAFLRRGFTERQMKIQLILAALAFSSFAAVASAQTTEVSGLIKVDVPYGDLNLSHPAGATAMLNRIRSAAVYVCSGKPDRHELTDMARYRSCVSAAIRNAVAELNAAGVTQIYSGNTRTTRGTYVSQR
jgi:UrcA family protein